MLALIVKALLTADVSPLLEAVMFFVPLELMLRSLNVARPVASVVLVVVPLKVPVPVVRVIVTDTPEVETLLPNASFSCTVTAGVIVCPAVVVEGC